MGIWDYICSSTDSLKGNAPDLTNIGNAVYKVVNPANLQALKQYLPDDESRQKIFQFTTCLAKNAAFETIKLVPGGDIARKVVTKSYKEVYKSDGLVNKEDNKKALDYKDFKCQIQRASNFGSAGHEDPADVIRSFMMKGFMGRHFLDSLIVPRDAHIYNNKKKK